MTVNHRVRGSKPLLGAMRTLTHAEIEDITDSIAYLRGVFPPGYKFDALVNGDPVENDSHVINGDDLASACHHLDMLMKHFPEDG